jgi:hypothetical protein
MSMRGPWLYSWLGLVMCAACSLAQTPPVAPVADPAHFAADLPSTESAAVLASPDGPPSRFWVCGEYLLWTIPGQRLPAVVGTIPVESADMIQRLSDSTIKPLFGDGAGRVDADWRSGLRVEAGLWLEESGQFGVEAGFFQLEQGRQHALFQSAAAEPLGITFHDSVAGQQVLIMDAVPGLRTGTVAIETSNRLWGAEANALWRLSGVPVVEQLRLLAGFRYLQFDEDLDVTSSSTAIPGGRLPCG